MPPTTLHFSQPVEVAYRHIAEGYRRALAVPDLPVEEVESIERCLLAAREIAGQSPSEAGA